MSMFFKIFESVALPVMAQNTAIITDGIFKNSGDFDRYSCLSCGHLLSNPVQLACGHRLCSSCADKLIATAKKEESTPRCPDKDCNEDINDEDGAYVCTSYA